jgi:hypothetical protein
MIESGKLTVEQAENLTGITQQQVSRWRHYLSDEPAYRERLLGAEYKAAALMEPDGTNVRGTQGTGDNEWFTPPEFIELAPAGARAAPMGRGPDGSRQGEPRCS